MKRHGLGKLVLAAACAALAIGPASAGPRLTGEEQLAKMIDGRVAGEAKSCIHTSPSSSNLTIIDRTALVYRSGGKIWVNRTAHPDDLDDDAVMVLERFDASSLCRQDTIRLVDRQTGMFRGVVFLEDFVPYAKAS